MTLCPVSVTGCWHLTSDPDHCSVPRDGEHLRGLGGHDRGPGADIQVHQEGGGQALGQVECAPHPARPLAAQAGRYSAGKKGKSNDDASNQPLIPAKFQRISGFRINKTLFELKEMRWVAPKDGTREGRGCIYPASYWSAYLMQSSDWLVQGLSWGVLFQ